MKRLKPSLFLTGILMLSLMACGGAAPAVIETPTSELPAVTNTPIFTATPVKKKILTLSWTQSFTTLSPLYSTGWFTDTTQQIWNCWAWNYDEKNEPYPHLVKEMPAFENGGISEDGLTITLHLRDDIKWSDGEPITANDFKFSWAMKIDPKNKVYSTYPEDLVASIDTPDAQTVVLNFAAPMMAWHYLFTGIIPAHILQPVYNAKGTLDGAEWNNKPTVGCGPYNFVEWQAGKSARFVRNENYFDAPAKIDEIIFRFVSDDNEQTAALIAGDADVGAFIPYSEVPALKRSGALLMTEPSGYNEGIFFQVNEKKSHPALLEVDVRKAIAMAIDFDSFNQEVNLGLVSAPGSFWDSLPYYNEPAVQPYPYDLEAAKKLLDEAGWVDSNNDGIRDKGGVEFVIQHGSTTREAARKFQVFAQQQLAQVGIQLETLNYDPDVFFNGYADKGPLYSGELDLQEWSDAPSGFPDPDVYYWLCSEIPSDENPSGTNSFYLCDEELDVLIQLQSTQLDSVERQHTISQINQIFHDKVYWLGVWQDPDVWAVSPRLRGVKFSGVSPFFNIAEWDIH